MAKKERKEIPVDLAAKVMFYSDRTCCVCRIPGKAIQIHHVDEDPSNNVFINLAVLCLDCHNDTMLSGGFGRKLNADQILLYRDDWIEKVAQNRAAYELRTNRSSVDDSFRIKYATSVAEIYLENKQYSLLATHYSILGNDELRDKYIELAIKEHPLDQNILSLRALQGRIDLVPDDVIQRELERKTENKDWSQRARLNYDLGRNKDAVQDYVESIRESLIENNLFSAAYYLKELCEKGLASKLFELALEQAAEERDLWWQVRALEELEWYSEINELVLRNAKEIEEEGDTHLLILLERARKNNDRVFELEKELARNTRIVVAGEE